jgi:uracil phosphoribosyltransferase
MGKMADRKPAKIRGPALKALRREVLSSDRVILAQEHPLVAESITQMRRKNISHKDYEKHVRRITDVLVVEAAKGFPLKERKMALDRGLTAGGWTVDVSLAIVPVMRAGLPMMEECIRFFPGSQTGFIFAERDEKTGQSKITSCKLPRLERHRTILLEQVIATGGTVSQSLELAKEEYGAGEISVLCCLSVPQGTARILEEHPEVTIYVAQMDETLDEHFFVRPGIGDAGDKTFGVYHRPTR